jgi:hypothetical protein
MFLLFLASCGIIGFALLERTSIIFLHKLKCLLSWLSHSVSTRELVELAETVISPKGKEYSVDSAPVFNESPTSPTSPTDEAEFRRWQQRILIEPILSESGQFVETIVMYYDTKREAFSYYSESQQTHRKYLNKVAAKYVNIYGCKSLFVETEPELESEAEAEAEAGDEAEAPTSHLESKAEKGGSVKKPWSQPPAVKNGRWKASSSLSRAGVFQDKLINKFIRVGKFRDFNPLRSATNNAAGLKIKKSVHNPKTELTWRDYVSHKDLHAPICLDDGDANTDEPEESLFKTTL